MSLIKNIKVLERFLIPSIVKEFIYEFDGIEEDYLIQVKLAKWHYSQKRYALAYLNLNESITRFIFEETKRLFPSSTEDDELKYAKNWINQLKPYFVGKNLQYMNLPKIKLKNLKKNI